MGSTLVFRTDTRSVVADSGERRDARATPERETAEAGVASGGRGRRRGRSILDLPDVDEAPKRNDGELVN